jgi:hypothetical protein
MAEYTGYSNTDWARSVATTIADHIREEESSWMKNFQLGALLESHGRITYNHGGRGFDWPVEYRAHTMEGNTGETARNFARRNKWKTAALPYRGYQVTDAIYKKELLENRGEAAVVKLWDDFLGRLEKSIKHGVATEFYVDGNATGNENAWHGFESMFQTNGTVTISSGAQRTANAADWVGYPNDSYATLSTVLGGSGGENSSGSYWPEGTCDPEFDFWSPLIVNYTSSAFGGAADTWVAQGDEAMRFMIIHSQRNSSVDGQMTNIFLNRSRYFEFLNLIDGKEQINITSENELRALGFKNTVVFDGVTVSWETGVPNTSPHEDGTRAMAGYGFNFNNMELKCMEDTLFKSDDVEYDIDTQAFKAVVYTLSNLRFASPRNFGKLISLA